MTKAKAPKQVVVIKAPKIVTAWNLVCKASGKAEDDIVKVIESLHDTMTNESRLSVADKKKFVKGLEESGKVSSFISSSHVAALPTWIALRSLHADFKALPVHKQLSTASASYDLLGSGQGEQIKTMEALTKAIAQVRKAKQPPTTQSTKEAKTPKDKKTQGETLTDILAFFTALDVAKLDESEQGILADIEATVGNLMANA
jgi:hypothetical protein